MIEILVKHFYVEKKLMLKHFSDQEIYQQLSNSLSLSMIFSIQERNMSTKTQLAFICSETTQIFQNQLLPLQG